jgi:SPP1 family predicted phage head-tail adaptor
MERLTQTGSGRLYFHIAFDKRLDEEDEYGNTVSNWVEQFQRRAEFRTMPGSETVMAARLDGRQPMQVNIRIDPEVALVGNDWQMRDVRNGLAYNIRDIRRDTTNRAMMVFMVEGGVATG